MKPHGQEEARDEVEQRHHRAAADLAGARRSRARSSSAIQNCQRGIRVRNRLRGERVRGMAGWDEPVRSSPSGWTDRWAQAVSQPF
jgi:hypothetical protein